jgi:hypothetical protein
MTFATHSPFPKLSTVKIYKEARNHGRDLQPPGGDYLSRILKSGGWSINTSRRSCED